MEAAEIGRIADFLGQTPETFIRGSCEKRHGRLYIRTGANGYCLYYHAEKGCLIHPVKPARCVQWPFFAAIVNDKDNWELAKAACPGINPRCSFEEFVAQAKKWCH